MKLGLKFVGGKQGFPLRTPFVILNYNPTLLKNFFGKTRRGLLIWRKNFWPNYLPDEYTSALKKMLAKWQFLFYICYVRKWLKLFKKLFLMDVLDLLCMDWDNFFEKKHKWQNLTILGKILPKFYFFRGFRSTPYVMADNGLIKQKQTK